jgi:iron complex transport system permease protein
MGMPLIGFGAMADTMRNLGMAGSAWIGSALILAIVMAVSSRIKDIMAILILGMMFGSAATAFVEILQYLSPEGTVKSFVVWTMGSLGGVSAGQLTIMAPVALAGLILSIVLIKPLNMLLLGENYARTMGMNVKTVRMLILLSTVLLAGTITAFCGPIGFIGIAVPHIARMLFSEADHRILMPASMLLGAAIMLLCDVVSQLPGYDMVLPINTITALLGIPVVIIVIIRNRKIF